MGSGASKAAKAAPRKFPARSPGTSPSAPAQTRAPRAAAAGRPLAATSKDEGIIADAMDPDPVASGFSQRLRQMGVADPHPTFSPTSTASHMPQAPSGSPLVPLYPSAKNNATLAVLEARKRLQERAEAEFQDLGRKGNPGREFLDMNTVIRILTLRDGGASPEAIESQLNLKAGVVSRLGRPGVVVPVAATRT